MTTTSALDVTPLPPIETPKPSAWDRLVVFAVSPTVLWLVVAAGALFRIVRYADNRSLWLDESLLTLNLLQKSARGLLGSLDYFQAAPSGFLLAEKLAVRTLGDGEYVLRLLPLLAGIASLFLFVAVARRFLSAGALLLAVTLFAVTEPLIYYSSEVKPYGSDVFVTLAVLLLACRALERDRLWSLDLLGLVVVGLAGIWFAYPTVFILSGAFVALAVRGYRTVGARGLVPLALIGAGWLASFGALYLVTKQNTSRIQAALFGPTNTHSTSGISSTVHAAWSGFVDPAGFVHGLNGLAVVMFCFGMFSLVRRVDLARFALLIVPLVAAFVAAFLNRYPLGGRFSLFLVPIVLVLVARGVQEVAERSRQPLLLALPIAAFLVIPPIATAGSHVVHPVKPENVRPLLGQLVASARPGDGLYVFRESQFALRYYGECKDCRAWKGSFPWPLEPNQAEPHERALQSVPASYIWVGQEAGSDQIQADLDDLDRLPRNRRIWFLFSHTAVRNGLDEKALFLAYLDRYGRRLDAREEHGASLYLYDLTKKAAPA
jgi:hypothetical protein